MRNSRLPLTETVYYLLLVFKKPTYGYLAIKEIEELSEGDVRIAAGTMYGAIENLLKSEMIVQVSSENERRKMYQTTAYGNEVLEEEVARLSHCVRVWEKLNR
ncbi:PadR family transcriptional regulator [Vagococcus sp. PNs007]|uniref:PadR family transcriptional regulator n=2 Tax=Vagococcus TaxID=2737 RepID=A0A430ABI7_9ENTE|nr:MULTISPECIES: PadR family transcriptional regulator [Vagococcus]MDF0479892.1 PadR family transcriptional regulator [Vagococcus proximus]RSU04614.1 PadR family transcriptional regulator [Vagococcus fessus]